MLPYPPPRSSSQAWGSLPGASPVPLWALAGSPRCGSTSPAAPRQSLPAGPAPTSRHQAPWGQQGLGDAKAPTTPGEGRVKAEQQFRRETSASPVQVWAWHPGSLLSSPRGDSVPSCVQVPASTNERARRGWHGAGVSPQQGSAPRSPCSSPHGLPLRTGSALGKGCGLGRKLSEGPRAVSVLRPQRPGPLWAVS